MTYWYYLERLFVALDAVEAAARDMECNHDVADWLAHRVAHIRGEAHSLRVEIEKTKGSDNART